MKKWIILALGSLLAAFLFWGFPEIIRHQVRQKISRLNLTQSAIQVKFHNFDSFWPLNDLTFHEVDVRVKGCRGDSLNSLTLKSRQMKIQDLSVWKLLTRQQVEIGAVQLENWSVDIVKGGVKDIYLDCIGDGSLNFPTLRIDRLSLEPGRLRLLRLSSDSLVTSGSTALSVEIEGFKLAPQGLWRYQNLSLSMSDLTFRTSDLQHHLRLAKLAVDSGKRTVRMDSLSFYTLEDRWELTDEEQTWFSLQVPQILMENFSLDSLLFHQHLASDQVRASGGNLLIAYDKRPAKRRTTYKELPHEWLEQLPLTYRYRKINIDSLQMAYHEYHPGRSEPGKLRFKDVSIEGSAADSRNLEAFRMNVQGDLIDRARLHVEISFLAGENPSYQIKGDLPRIPLSQINPMLAYVSENHIISGVSHHLSFAFSHGNSQATGSLQWQFQDLKVGFNEEKGELNLLENVQNLVANTLVINNQNMAGDDFRQGTIQHTRDNTRSVINLWWKALASGLESSL